jgi:hypothetical protein
MLQSSARRAMCFLLFGVSAKSKDTNFSASFAPQASEYERAVSLSLNINDLISYTAR